MDREQSRKWQGMCRARFLEYLPVLLYFLRTGIARLLWDGWRQTAEEAEESRRACWGGCRQLSCAER